MVEEMSLASVEKGRSHIKLGKMQQRDLSMPSVLKSKAEGNATRHELLLIEGVGKETKLIASTFSLPALSNGLWFTD